jgi:hypothetical protein
MKSASSCFALCVAMMLGCKGGNFTDKSANVTTAASQEAARVETIAAEENDDEVTEVRHLMMPISVMSWGAELL